MSLIEDPLVAPPAIEVPLKNAPLVRVIAQVRFPAILAIEQPDFVAPFQETLRATYPVLRKEQAQGLLIAPAGVASVKPQTAWRFADVDGHWRVSLTPDFLALETTNYRSRSEFLTRLRAVVAALGEHVEPKLIDRLGVRFIDRITGAAVDDITKLVRSEVRGIIGTAAGSHVVHTLSETMFELDDARVVARWGCLPPETTIDPGAIEPVPDKSWILDLDMFTAKPVPFVADQVVKDAERYAERIYTFFRWAVTDDFLRRYGGKL
ncbi:MAG: TIGR04255 family protein [Candidatus Rokubacteria bacterium]|nr:TIGR04255 family protein [Candidatus Rokubacteria bacterium]